jgi:hypothetical protein
MRFANLLVTGAVTSLVLCAPAWANMVITPTFNSTITSDANSAAIEGAINSAIAVYEADFSDPINVHITFQEGGGLGASNTPFENLPYATYRAALVADAKTADDATAIATLPTLAQYNTLFPSAGGNINVKTANLRAVGLSGSANPDGTITLNTSLTTPGSAGTGGSYFLQVVAEHEIDEVLGLGSSLPDIQLGAPFPEDLFRYTSTPGVRSFTTSSSATSFFSIDGTTDLAQFDNQNDGGDFGDWQSNPLPFGVQPKVQDAFATPGADPALSVELRALDVIGYDRVIPPPVPEPGTAALLAVALAILAGRWWGRRFRLPLGLNNNSRSPQNS